MLYKQEMDDEWVQLLRLSGEKKYREKGAWVVQR